VDDAGDARTEELGIVLGGEPHGYDLRVVPALLLDQVEVVLLLGPLACEEGRRIAQYAAAAP
jgi:hypothetical protein